MLNPESRFRIIWNLFLTALITIVAVDVPLRIALVDFESTNHVFLDWLITLVFGIDIILNFFTAIRVRGKLITNHTSIRNHYLRGNFWIDLISTIPLDLILAGTFGLYGESLRLIRIVRLNRLFRLSKLFEYIQDWRTSQFFNPSFLRLLFFIYWILLLSHWIACGWILIGAVASVPGGDLQYVTALYWTVTTLTTVGFGDLTPDKSSMTQMIYTMMVMFTGVGVYGYVIGNVASLLANLDVARAAFLQRMENINAFMLARNVPSELQDRVRQYYDHVWELRRGQDEATIIRDLPPSLQIDISLFLNRRILQSVPLFKNATEELIRDLVCELKPVIFTPGDFIIRKGEVGSNMFFISTGSVDVVSPDGRDVYAHLSEGSFFGEMALIFNKPRTASIRAVDYCDVYTLDKADFDRVLSRYPETRAEIETVARERMNQSSSSSES